MKPRQRVLALVLAVPGIFLCVGTVAAFVLRMSRNGLPDGVGTDVRASYLAVGDAFSHGFAVGFFLCFFLMLVAFVVGTWVEHRRTRRSPRTATPDVLSR